MVCSLVSICFDNPQLGVQGKKTVWNFGLLIQRYVQFSFFRKRSGNSFSTMFCVWFFKKNVSHVIINWLNFINRSSLIYEILGNMYIAVVCFPRCDVTNFDINPAFLIKPFLYMSKKLRQKLKYLEKELLRWNKSIFHHF